MPVLWIFSLGKSLEIKLPNPYTQLGVGSNEVGQEPRKKATKPLVSALTIRVKTGLMLEDLNLL